MDVAVIGVFIPIIAIVAISAIIVYIRRFENEERLAMIEKGMNPKDMKIVRNTSFPLRFALLLIGVGIGLFVGYILDSNTYMDEVAYFSMIFIWGGIGMGLSYLIEEKKSKVED